MPVVDEVKGRVPEVYIALKPGYVATKEITERVIATIETMIGKIARPKTVHIVPDLPKTRSGKIMRRVLAAISNNISTSYTPVFYAYTTAFSNNNYYYAAALSVVLAIITCIFSFSVLRVTQRQAGV